MSIKDLPPGGTPPRKTPEPRRHNPKRRRTPRHIPAHRQRRQTRHDPGPGTDRTVRQPARPRRCLRQPVLPPRALAPPSSRNSRPRWKCPCASSTPHCKAVKPSPPPGRHPPPLPQDQAHHPTPRSLFACLFLDTRHRIIRYEELFSGTIDGAAVYPWKSSVAPWTTTPPPSSWPTTTHPAWPSPATRTSISRSVLNPRWDWWTCGCWTT